MKLARRQTPRFLEYDGRHRRLWIGGQRLHHGATGSLFATMACLALLAGHVKGASATRPLVAMVAAGGALMAHDWNDRSLWFQLGRGSQP